MNKKGQIGVGAIIITFMGIVAVLAMLAGGISGSVGELTKTQDVVNDTINLTDYVTVTLEGKYITDFVMVNMTQNKVITSGNYTITNNVLLSDGTLGATLTGAAVWPAYNNTNVLVNYTFQPLGYVPEAGARTIAGMIIMFSALAIMVFTLVPTLRNGVINLVGK